MNNQGKQMVIDALYKVINSAPQPYQNNMYPYNTYSYPKTIPNNTNLPNEITKQQFDIWKKYVCDVLDISYNNLALYDIMTTKLNIEQLALQPTSSYMQLVNRIQNELICLIRIIIQL